MNVKLIHVTPEAEKVISYCARVSNPKNQDNPDYAKLLAYCIKHGHWSIFEMASLCMEITTSRAIGAQLIRHKSFSFQEFSQRYAEVGEFEHYKARKQDLKNRQNSTDDLEPNTKAWFHWKQFELQRDAKAAYDLALEKGIAKESARFLLPMSIQTKMYMHGTIRSWVHYITLRTDPSTQLEHREIALECKRIFKEQLPIVAKALGW
jgi:thymidylate synthase (FAD)